MRALLRIGRQKPHNLRVGMPVYLRGCLVEKYTIFSISDDKITLQLNSINNLYYTIIKLTLEEIMENFSIEPIKGG